MCAGMGIKKRMGEIMSGYVDEMPVGLFRAVSRIMEKHHGREKAIKKGDLLRAVRLHGFDPDERVLRQCISDLRKQGALICAASSADGGYYIAQDWEELHEFIAREIESRIIDLSGTKSAMEKGAARFWGPYIPHKQLQLFK